MAGGVKPAVCSDRRIYALRAPQRAAPSKPVLSLRITRTGIAFRTLLIRPFAVKAVRKLESRSFLRTRGAIPPPMKIPPVAMSLSARLPASLP